MNSQLIAVFAAISACNARVEGMKAENQHRLNCENGVAYGDDAFAYEAKLLDELSIEARNAQ